MNTTRIDHTGHNHPSTTAARTACRKALAAGPTVELVPVCHIGRSSTTHALVVTDTGVTVGARCGAGLQRGRRAPSAIYRAADAPVATIDCGRCNG
jgi:hypothetical protein